MDRLLLFLLIFSAFTCLVLLIYPLVAYLKAVFVKTPTLVPGEFNMPVSIIIAAYNEENSIKDKILFFLKEEEWIPGSELIVISAGSTDRTNNILMEFAETSNLRLVIIKEHVVKPMALNIAVSYSKNDLLVFSDCRQIIKKGSLINLVNYFKDETIGTVNSTILDTQYGGKISFMRWICNSICFNESISGSSLNLHGALYGQRKSLFQPFPNDILHDDLFVIVSTIIQNKRLVQARNVVIYDMGFDVYYCKSRLERLARGLMIFLFSHWASIKKLPPYILVRFILFKYLKLLLPFLLIGILFPLTYFIGSVIPYECIYSFIGLFLLLLIYKRSRRFILLFCRINVYFMTAVFKFFVLKKRELNWEKLTVKPIA